MDKTAKKQAAFFYRLAKAIRRHQRKELARQLWQIRKILREPMPEF